MPDVGMVQRAAGALWRYPVTLLALNGVIGGAGYSVSKIALENDVEPLGIATWQVLGAGLFLLLAAVIRGERPTIRRPDMAFTVICGLPCLALPMTVTFIALAHLPAGLMGLIVATMPIFTYAISLCLGQEAARGVRILGLGCGLAGALILLAPGLSLPSAGAAPWIALAFVTPMMLALGNIFVARKRPAGMSAPVLSFGMLFAAACVMVPVSVATGAFYVPNLVRPGVAEAMILIQMAIASLNYVFFFEIIRRAGPVFYAQIGYLLTVTAFAWAVLLFDDTYGVGFLAAVGLIFAGIALSRRAGTETLVRLAPGRPGWWIAIGRWHGRVQAARPTVGD